MTEEELLALGEEYIKLRPNSYLYDIDVENCKIITWFHGALLTSDAYKVKEMLGLNNDAGTNKSEQKSA